MDSKVAPPILMEGGDIEPMDSPLGGTGMGESPPTKDPPGTMKPEEKGGDQNPEVHPDTGVKVSRVTILERLSWGVGLSSGESVEEPPVFDGAAESYLGYGSSDEEFAEEGEVTVVGTDGAEFMRMNRPGARGGTRW